MLRLRPTICAALACATIPLVASCASVVDGTGYPAGAAPLGGAAAFPTSAAGLAQFLHHGLAAVHTAHLTLHETAGPTTVTASGDETIENGKTKDFSLSEQISPLGTLKLIVVNGNTYVQVPPDKRTSAKPWSRLSPSTSDPYLRTLYEQLAGSKQITGLDSTRLFVQAAGNLRFTGRQTLDGTTVGHYALVVRVDKLPADFPNKAALLQAGLKSIPVELWVDGQGRTRKFIETVSVAGQTLHAQATLGDFDAPVHISAPPPDQVSDN